MQVEVGYSDNPDSTLAGRWAAKQALDAAKRPDTCDLVLLFCTARHNQRILRRVVAEITGNSHCIFGGGAAGVITNQEFGYAGDQVGLACIWLDNSGYHVLTEGGLNDGEFDVGLHMGRKLAKINVTPDSPVMLFYDANDRTPGNNRFIMSTWLLEGIEKQLGFLPDLMGAGLIGDHIFTPSSQFLGHDMDKHHAFALAFSDDICIDHIILHGCRPASPYYTVTKADASTILEIEGKPAISFIDELLKTSITPEEYPFFLILGINHGQGGAAYNEKNYASRLCQGIDKERGGIIMFEPDMVAGTRFQIMSRTLKPGYIRPKINSFLNSLKDRDPFFAMYINCAGRGAGYGGADFEDAYVIQDIVQHRFPLFGLYTGVEIASIGGKPRSLDWTSVFCVFSKSKNPEQKKTSTQNETWSIDTSTSHQPRDMTPGQIREMCIQNMARILALDAQNIATRYELEQKRRGFSLLAELSVALRKFENQKNLFLATTRRINAALNMQKTVLLIPGIDGNFIPSVLQGYNTEEKAELAGTQLEVDPELFDITKTLIVTAANDENYLAGLRQKLKLPYFISTPIIVENELAGILITGRMQEAPPFLSRLSENEAKTVQAIVALLASIMVYQRLDEVNRQASTDVLTGLYNRGALEQRVTTMLKQKIFDDFMFAFILIDLDYFKTVNDRYGHIVGDRVLKIFARTLRDSLRTTDIVSRFGGDEFAAFCTSIRDIESIQTKIARLVENWSKTPLYSEKGEVFYTTISAGISIAPYHGTDYIELLHKADIALYETKEGGRNGYSIYDQSTMKKL